MKRLLSGRFSFLIPAGAFALLLLVVYADPLFFRRNFGGRDLTAYNLPMESAIHDAYARGRLPVWMSEISGGRPLLPNPNAGALYPARMLLAALPFPLAMRLFPVLHWLAAGIGMMILLRSLGASRGGAWIGAITLVFSGVAVSEVFFPHIQPGFTWLPWILWAQGREKGSRTRRVLILSILFALVMLAGDVFTIALSILCCLIWIGSESKPQQQRGQLVDLGGAVLLATLAALPQITATALWIPETNRAILGMTLSEVFYFSVPPLRLLELVVPFPFGPTWSLDTWAIWGVPLFQGRSLGLFDTLYCGAFALVAFAATWSQSRRGMRFARAVVILGVAFSVLPSLLPSAWGKWHAPLALRNPEKLAVAFVLGLAILCGFALDRLRDRWRWDRGVLAIGGVLALLAAVCSVRAEAAGSLAARLIGAGPVLAKVAAQDLAKSLAEGGVAWVLTFLAIRLATRGRRAAGVALVLLTALPIFANRRIARTFGEEEIFAPSAFAHLQRRLDPPGRFRTLGEALYQPTSKLWISHVATEFAVNRERRDWCEYTQALWKRGTVFNADFDSGDLARVEGLRKVSARASGYRDSGRFFESFSLRWGIRFRDQRSLAGYRRIGGDALQDWDEDPAALPDIRLATAWREEPSAISAVNVLPVLEAGEIVLETGRRAAGRASNPGRLDFLETSPERLVLRVRSSSPQWLFVLRDFWAGRSVSLDGRQIDCVPAQVAFSAVAVPPGDHRIVWEEKVPGLPGAAAGPVIFVGVLAFGLARSRSERRKTT